MRNAQGDNGFGDGTGPSTSTPAVQKPRRQHLEMSVGGDTFGAGEMIGPELVINPNTPKGPVIIYASRTHSQLAQVIKELKASRYRPRMAVIGSRQQMCVHKEVKHLTGNLQQNACKQKTENRTCAHYNEVDRFIKTEPDYGKDVPVDIEDLTKLGERGRHSGGCGPCPYYLSQNMADRAEIIFMPYNYLIDPKLRDGVGKKIQWKNAVLLFDEAHNVESACADAASFELTAVHLAAAVREAQQAFEIRAAEEESEVGGEKNSKQPLAFNARGRDVDDGFGGGGERLGVNGMKNTIGGDFQDTRTALEYKQLRGILLALEAKISEELTANGTSASGASNSKELVRSPTHFFDMLLSLKISDQGEKGGSVKLLTDLMRSAVLLLSGEAAAVGQKSKSKASSFKLQEVADALDKAFTIKKDGNLDQFRLRIGAQDDRGNGYGSGGFNSKTSSTSGPTLSFWCFSPGVVMRALREKGIRNIILTSGTLSPMSSFASELSVPFPVRLENPHVIQSDQVWGGIVPVGPSGKKLNSSYRFRDTEEYKSELGNVIVNFSRIVPDGLLVFFPSYTVMRSCIESWKSYGTPTIWERICTAKHAVTEPTNKAEFATAFNEFNNALGLNTTRLDERFIDDEDGQVARTGEVARHKGGAVFFAVCRGKVSEGIDFPDKAGRAVILTGIPYAPKADAKVRLKRGFLDQKVGEERKGNNNKQSASTSGTTSNNTSNNDSLSGEQWYSQTAMRAVNQALGRVIRHRNDHGAVILCDERFAYGNVRGQLSVWLRPAIQNFDAFGPAAAQLSQFFKRCALSARGRLNVSCKGVSSALNGLNDSNDGSKDTRRSTGLLARGGPVGNALPKRFLVADPAAAPPAYPKMVESKSATGLAAALAAGRAKATGGGSASETPSATGVPAKTTGIAGMLARARTGGEINALRRANVDDTPRDLANNPDHTSSTPDTIRVFMRRAKHELTQLNYDELTKVLREFKQKSVDVAHVLRVATKVLNASEKVGVNDLYTLFGAFVPTEHKYIHEKHLVALRERFVKGDGGRGDIDTPAEKGDSSLLSKKRRRDNGNARALNALSRGAAPVGGITGSGTSSSDIQPTVSVARPPPRCVLCGNACGKPFTAKCGHPACYGCWLELFRRCAEKKANANCPSCRQPVQKKHLNKVFFT